jgi:hypothetical protein
MIDAYKMIKHWIFIHSSHYSAKCYNEGNNIYMPTLTLFKGKLEHQDSRDLTKTYNFIIKADIAIVGHMSLQLV